MDYLSNQLLALLFTQTIHTTQPHRILALMKMSNMNTCQPHIYSLLKSSYDSPIFSTHHYSYELYLNICYHPSRFYSRVSVKTIKREHWLVTTSLKSFISVLLLICHMTYNVVKTTKKREYLLIVAYFLNVTIHYPYFYVPIAWPAMFESLPTISRSSISRYYKEHQMRTLC